MSTLTQPYTALEPSEIKSLIEKARYISEFEKALQIAEDAQYHIDVLKTIKDRAEIIYRLHWEDYTIRQQEQLRKDIVKILTEIYLKCGSTKFYSSIERLHFIKKRELQSIEKKREKIVRKLMRADDIAFLPFLHKRFLHLLGGIFG